MKRTLSLPSLLAALLAAGPLHAADDAVRSVPITVVEAKASDLEIKASAPGELESPADPAIAAEVEGRVLKVMVDEGDIVDAGQVLATLDEEPYAIALESAQANVARIEAVITNQRLTVKRLRDLMQRRASAQSDLDRANAELTASRAELTAARAQVRDAEYRLAKSNLRSPNRGMVQARKISPGDYVKKGDPAFEIVATERLSARLFVPEQLAGRIRTGLSVALFAGGDTRTVQTQISRVLPALDPSNRALSVMVDFDNPHHWRPGMSIDAEITLERHNGAVTVPARSIVRRPAGTVVYVIKDGRAVAQRVETGARDGEQIEIVSGLEAGNAIADDGAGFLTDGAAVALRETQP